MEKDVVCGMQVDPGKAAGTSQYKGRRTTSARRAARRSSTRIPASTRNERARAVFLAVGPGAPRGSGPGVMEFMGLRSA